MKFLMLSLIAAMLLAGAANSVFRPHPLPHFGQHGMASIQDMQTGRADKLSEQELQDRSVLFAKEPR
ncbi:hypothetical protein GPL17_09035 [Bradyrhizobium yuanmingense]|uniref:hypothetical protein n=1 Tax=Bradyrhizobium yuanmingense TaxID=108015 RepID=UPI0012F7A631|nr:hypothetical protein [Bradyrhizobium yuanmingense]MDF0496785.1 hypothetical protein [Bradyrhizobium yuanmingense]MVT50637.1 hypothetical protein [Bradyrhizobium yuanmingense]